MQAHHDTTDALEPPSHLHQLAVFGTPDQQEQAIKQIRANSAHGPSFWKTLDGAFRMGYLNPTLKANSSPRANAQVMDYEEWVDRSDDIIDEVNLQLTLMDDALAIDTVSSSLSYTEYTEQVESEGAIEAERSMDGRAKSDQIATAKGTVGIATPMTHVDYRVSSREQAQSENMGSDKEARKAREAGRILRESEDKLMLDGWDTAVPMPEGGTLTVDGYRNTAGRIQGSASGSWTTSSPGNVQDTIEKALSDFENQGGDSDRNMMPRSRGAYLYYNTAHNAVLDKKDPRGDGNMNVRTRLQQDHPYVQLRETPMIPEDEIVMVINDPQTLSVVDSQAPTNLSWDSGPMVTNFKALSCRNPFFRSTYQGVSGVLHYTGV